MDKMEKKIYMAAGYNTISLGTGRKEFHPAKPRPGIDHYIKEAGSQVLKNIGGAEVVDETVIGNFMAGRFNGQAHLGAFAPFIDEGLAGKPSTRVEGACASGGLALLTGIKSVLSGSAEVVLALGVEVQNSVKAMYGADILAAAGWAADRKGGHAFFFPGQFSDRAGVYFERYGRERTRKAFARWYRNAIENARLCPTAQEYHNTSSDLEALAMAEPNGAVFVDYLNYLDCSKVSDGASAIAIVSRDGLRRIGIPLEDAVEITGFGHAVSDITQKPVDPAEMTTGKLAAEKALAMAEISIGQVGTVETHDCFTIAGILGVEALGLAKKGEGPDYVLAGETSRTGEMPFNTTGGLIGWGHPTGATGVHMAVTLWEQLTGKAGDAQINIRPARPYGLSLNMGGDDKTLVSIVYKRGE